MYILNDVVNCEEGSNRETPFRLIIVRFDPETNVFDNSVLKTLEKEGSKLAGEVNPAAANNSKTNRQYERLLNNCIAGVLAEYCWRVVINAVGCKNLVQRTKYLSARNQIDLALIHNNKKIEIRSSFPRNGIDFALCHKRYEFDVIGPYSNTVKPGETQKDFYLRTLYPIASTKIQAYISNNNCIVYLTGGATWEMMNSPDIYKTKTFIPEDEIELNITQSEYRVIPFSKALDTIEVINLIQS